MQTIEERRQYFESLGVRTEGYWNNAANYYPELPLPVASDFEFEGKAEVLERLTVVEEEVTRDRMKLQFMGFSVCRCCGIRNGTAEFVRGPWRWPIGLRHYIEEHNVKPSDAFLADVLGM